MMLTSATTGALKYVRLDLVGSGEDCVVEVPLEPCSFDISDPQVRKDEACERLGLPLGLQEPRELFSAFSWAFNEEKGTCALLVFDPRTIEFWRKSLGEGL